MSRAVENISSDFRLTPELVNLISEIHEQRRNSEKVLEARGKLSLVVYADLIATADRRNLGTAQMIMINTLLRNYIGKSTGKIKAVHLDKILLFCWWK